MNVKIALDLDLMFNEVMLQSTLGIWENGKAIGHTWVNKGAFWFILNYYLRYICDARIYDGSTVLSSVEAIP